MKLQSQNFPGGFIDRARLGHSSADLAGAAGVSTKSIQRANGGEPLNPYVYEHIWNVLSEWWGEMLRDELVDLLTACLVEQQQPSAPMFAFYNRAGRLIGAAWDFKATITLVKVFDPEGHCIGFVLDEEFTPMQDGAGVIEEAERVVIEAGLEDPLAVPSGWSDLLSSETEQ